MHLCSPNAMFFLSGGFATLGLYVEDSSVDSLNREGELTIPMDPNRLQIAIDRLETIMPSKQMADHGCPTYDDSYLKNIPSLYKLILRLLYVGYSGPGYISFCLQSYQVRSSLLPELLGPNTGNCIYYTP